MGHQVFHLEYSTDKEEKRTHLKYDKIGKLSYLKRHFGFSYRTFKMYKKVGFETVDENEEEYIMVCRL